MKNIGRFLRRDIPPAVIISVTIASTALLIIIALLVCISLLIRIPLLVRISLLIRVPLLIRAALLVGISLLITVSLRIGISICLLVKLIFHVTSPGFLFLSGYIIISVCQRILSGKPTFLCTLRSVLLAKYAAFSPFSLMILSI